MTSEVVQGVDCIALVIDYLNPLVTPTVHGRVPATRPARFYRVSAAGGPGFEGKVLWRQVLTIEAWAQTEPVAYSDLTLATALLEAETVDFYAECSAPVSLPDPDTGSPRYLSTVQIAVRGTIVP